MTSILYGRLITILGVCYENYELLTIPMALIFEVLNLGDGLNMVVQGKAFYQNLSPKYKITMEYMFFKATQRTKNVMKYNTHFR
jgi:hypothetical protein